MALNLSNEVINTMKSGADIAGIPNEGTRFLIELLDLQQKNVFEIILYPADFSLNLSLDSLTSVGTTILDSTVAKLHIQSISVNFKEIEYENADLVYFPKSLIKPTDVTIEFLENEVGIVRNYMQYWMNEIVVRDPFYGYVFKDNQLGAKKNANIIPKMGMGLPSTGTVQLDGLKFKSMESLTFSHGDPEPMTLNINFSVDNVYWKTLTNLIG